MAKEGAMLLEITPEQLQALIVTAVRAAREPDPETAARLAKERERAELIQNERIATAKAEEAAHEQRQSSCNHMKDEGRSTRTAVMASYNSDGKIHPICVRCQKLFEPFVPADPLAYSATRGFE